MRRMLLVLLMVALVAAAIALAPGTSFGQTELRCPAVAGKAGVKAGRAEPKAPCPVGPTK